MELSWYLSKRALVIRCQLDKLAFDDGDRELSLLFFVQVEVPACDKLCMMIALDLILLYVNSIVIGRDRKGQLFHFHLP